MFALLFIGNAYSILVKINIRYKNGSFVICNGVETDSNRIMLSAYCFNHYEITAEHEPITYVIVEFFKFADKQQNLHSHIYISEEELRPIYDNDLVHLIYNPQRKIIEKHDNINNLFNSYTLAKNQRK